MVSVPLGRFPLQGLLLRSMLLRTFLLRSLLPPSLGLGNGSLYPLPAGQLGSQGGRQPLRREAADQAVLKHPSGMEQAPQGLVGGQGPDRVRQDGGR